MEDVVLIVKSLHWIGACLTKTQLIQTQEAMSLSPAAQRSISGRRSSRNAGQIPPSYNGVRRYRLHQDDQLFSDNRGGTFLAQLREVAMVDGKLACEILTSQGDVTKVVSLDAFAMMCPTPLQVLTFDWRLNITKNTFPLLSQALAKVAQDNGEWATINRTALAEEQRHHRESMRELEEERRLLALEEVDAQRLRDLVVDRERRAKAAGHRLMQTRRNNRRLKEELKYKDALLAELKTSGNALLAEHTQLKESHAALSEAYELELMPPHVLSSSDEEPAEPDLHAESKFVPWVKGPDGVWYGGGESSEEETVDEPALPFDLPPLQLPFHHQEAPVPESPTFASSPEY
jgi:hypothetical protein